MRAKKDLKEALENLDWRRSYCDVYEEIYKAAQDYASETMDYCLDECFEDFVSADVAEDMAKEKIEDGGLYAIYCFLGDVNGCHDYYRIDGYGNLAEIDKDDLEYLIDDILDTIDANDEDEEDSDEDSEE